MCRTLPDDSSPRNMGIECKYFPLAKWWKKLVDCDNRREGNIGERKGWFNISCHLSRAKGAVWEIRGCLLLRSGKKRMSGVYTIKDWSGEKRWREAFFYVIIKKPEKGDWPPRY